ncbi:MAG: PSD1 and planctomycete cytochrome C domain-containing protein [Bryobacteraceae bacterium]
MLSRPVLILFPALAAFAQNVDFQRDIRPLLAKNCLACHGPDDKSRQGNLRLDLRDGAIGKMGGSAGIVPFDSATSKVIQRVTAATNPMPPGGKRLTETEVASLKRWIDTGARYQKHWAFEKPVRTEPPQSKWGRNPIDAFVMARLEKEGLQPSREADRHTLIRRVSLDLTGLPPTPEQVEAFVKDRGADAYERLVKSLLASDHYGERWARVWLDLARYADSQGYEKDNKRIIWPYRDWVIRAFNANMPFDRFTTLQLAGDLLPDASQDDLIATGFHRNTMTNTEGGTDDEEFRDAAIKDRVATTGQVWMGLTWGCAQCHSHKYDPLAHKEFYQIYAFFNQTEDEDKPDDRPTLKFANTSTLIMRELAPEKRRRTRIHERGSFLNPGADVEPAVPAAFHPLPEGAPRNRLGLAKWLMDPENPLVARVAVNRFWARLFGTGIVESEEDFGSQGMLPSHPELLDWLATEYIRLGWDTKALLETIVLSATYRQSSDVTPALTKRDPYNRILARGPRFRLDSEIVRDQALAASGLLSAKMYGAPVMPWQPDGIWQMEYNSERWSPSPGEDKYRRALYTFWRRTAPYPAAMNFDSPSGETCTMRRIRTNTPLQALTTLNDPVQMEAAQRLALRVANDTGQTAEQRAERMFRMVLVRPPRPEETLRLVKLHREARHELDSRKESVAKLLHYDRVLYPEERTLTLVADTRTQAATARYRFDDPGTGWTSAAYDDSSWKTGQGVFAHFRKKPEEIAEVGTPWDADAVWMRYTFDLPAEKLEDFRLQIRYVGGFEAFLNGVSFGQSNMDRSIFHEFPVSHPATAAARPGRNVLAIRAYRTREKEDVYYVDAGLTAKRPVEGATQRKEDVDRAAWVVVANTVLNLDETLTRR